MLHADITGSGPAVTVLHGAVLPIIGTLTGLADDHLLIAPHFRGHGLSPDTDEPFSFESMAEDVIELLASRETDVDLVGYSMGAGLALHIAAKRPDLISRLVLISTALRSTDWHDTVRTELADMESKAANYAEELAHGPLGKSYPSLDWAELFRKTAQMQSRSYDWSMVVSKIRAETLLIYGDHDGVKSQGRAAFWEALSGDVNIGLNGKAAPNRQLAIIPNQTHAGLINDPQVKSLIEHSLNSPQVQ